MASNIEKWYKVAGLRRALMKPTHMPGSQMAARLSLTIKTHKGPGAVTARAIHACAGYTWRAFGMWAAGLLREKLSTFPHLVKDSFELQKRVSGIKVSSMSRFAKVDIKDYFYSGDARMLVEDALAIFGNNQPKYLKEVLMFLCENQYVTLPSGNDPHKVICGSGMGLPQSGDLCDAAYLTKVEKWLLNPSVAAKTNLRAYFRFRDDILFIHDRNADGSSQFLKMFDHCKVQARYFKLICESASAREVKFLEMRLRMEGAGITTVYSHKEAQGAPLCSSSGHPRSVHLSWPQSLRNRIVALTTHRKEARDAVDRFSERCNLYAIQMTESNSIFPKSPVPQRSNTVWIPMGFHPVYSRALQRSLEEFLNEYRLLTGQLFASRGSGTVCDNFNIAWYNRIPCLAAWAKADFVWR